MNLLYIGDEANNDKAYLDIFSKMPALSGHSCKTSFAKRENATEVALLAKSHKIDAVITSQQSIMEACLRQMPDFIAPIGRKGLKLNDYAGSWLTLPYDIPLLVINPLERLQTIPEEKYILDRYLSKLTKPQRWFPQTEFLWKQVFEHTVDKAIKIALESDLIAIDIETCGEGDVDKAIDLVGYACYSFKTKECKIFVVDFNSEWAWRFVQKMNKTPAAKIFQNGQYDNTYFARWNCLPVNWLWDTLTLMHCWYSELPKNLGFISAFAIRKVRFWKDDGASGSIEDKMRYNALDVWGTLNSFLSLMSEIPAYAARNYAIEFPMNFPSINCALEGLKVDMAAFEAAKTKKEAEAEAILVRAQFLLSDNKFNPRSPVQMKRLFGLLGCGHLKTTGAADMLKARYASPLNEFLLGLLVDYKKAATLISNYLNKEKIWNERFYYAIDPAGTDTGRSASKASAFWVGGNIQKIPRGDIIKSYISSDNGWLLGEADKAQSEARCVGYMAGETKLIDLVEGPHDYHAWNAAEFFSITYEKIYDEPNKTVLNEVIRDLSKRTNHGANYNMGDRVMLDTMGPKMVAKAKQVLKLPLKMRLVQVCEFLLNKYATTYPRIKGLFQDKIIAEIEITNKLVSSLGWTRYFFAKPSRRNKPALNAAIAHGPQNLSVSILNKEWYIIWRETIYGSLRDLVRVKAQIHDSILFQYRTNFDPRAILAFMDTPIKVTGADGVIRTMLIPSDLKCGADKWSKLKKV